MGIDYVPAAIEAAAAESRGVDGLSYVAGDVTRLPSAHLGTFDFFLDIGCFQGLDAGQRLSQGGGVSALANPGATLLLLSFGPSRWRPLVGGASQEEVQTAFAGWEMLGRAGGHRGPGLADEQDRAAVVPAVPTDLERHCPVSRSQTSARRCRGPRTRAELRMRYPVRTCAPNSILSPDSTSGTALLEYLSSGWFARLKRPGTATLGDQIPRQKCVCSKSIPGRR